MPIIEVSSSNTSADLLADHTCRDRYISVSVFAVTSSILLIGYVSSLYLVCVLFSLLLYISFCPMWDGQNWSDQVVCSVTPAPRVAVVLLLQFLITYWNKISITIWTIWSHSSYSVTITIKNVVSFSCEQSVRSNVKFSHRNRYLYKSGSICVQHSQKRLSKFYFWKKMIYFNWILFRTTGDFSSKSTG